MIRTRTIFCFVRPGRSILFILAPFCLAAFCGCASLPNVQKMMDRDLSNSDEPTKIMGPHGEFPSKKSDAIIKRLENQVDPTELLRQQVQLMQSIGGSPMVAGNKVSLLIDGEATYAAMLEAIENAKDNINFQTFIFEDDAVGKQFSDLLIKKSAAGVQVNLIYDSFGSLDTPDAFFQRLRAGGVNVLEFNPIEPWKVLKGKKWNVEHRDHRKILVVDGAVAFTGGVNISGVYSGSSATRSSGGKAEAPWRDTHVRIEGPAAAQFQKFFLNTWKKQKGPALPERDYFPELKHAGNTLVQVVGNLPGETKRRIFTMYISAITHAQNSIYLTTPYFVPDAQMLQALTEAAARGVDVKILLPGTSDSTLVYYASRHYYSTLLKAGVQLFERHGGMLHAKTAVIDDVWSTVGSNNLDTLSFLTNDEANAVILGRNFADSMQAMFADDLKESDRIIPEEWEKRSVRNRFKEWFSSLFSHWL